MEGVSNSGKTEFIDLIREIFPVEDFKQVVGSSFQVDYSERANYDFTRVHPCFVIIDEGAYPTLMSP